MFGVTVVADSVSPARRRIVTLELTYPRFIHSELLTHRLFSRNSASSRAVPGEKIFSRVEIDPVVPLRFGQNQKGMVAGDDLSPEDQKIATEIWLSARDRALLFARSLGKLGVHKTLPNRIVEPYSWITTVLTTTSLAHFLRLRDAPDAEDHFHHLAQMIRAALDASIPRQVPLGGWHLPYLDQRERELNPVVSRTLSVARCARISLYHQGEIRGLGADLRLHDQLLASGHFSPFEHQAQALAEPLAWSRNFQGWMPYRATLPNEYTEEPLYDGLVLRSHDSPELAPAHRAAGGEPGREEG